MLSADSVSVCLCPNRSVTQRKKDSGTVFVSTAIENTKHIDRFTGRIVFATTFAVERSWKGAEVSEITLYSQGGCAV
jgi:hypothetical protein